MKNKKDRTGILIFLVMVAVLAIALFLDKWTFEAVYNSDMPDWLKYVLLR